MKMQGVTFGDKHSYKDFGLILSSKSIGMPEPKTETVDVTGLDGVIDLTETLGDEIRYKNRTLSFEFSLIDGAKNWQMVLSKLAMFLHGKKQRITLDADKTYYYYGRCTIDSFKTDKTLAKITVDCDCDPYKQPVNEPGTKWLWDPFSFINGVIRNNKFTVDGTAEILLINDEQRVSPTFISTADMVVNFEGTYYGIKKGKTKVYDIRLNAGENRMTLIGKGDVTVMYKGGSL